MTKAEPYRWTPETPTSNNRAFEMFLKALGISRSGRDGRGVVFDHGHAPSQTHFPKMYTMLRYLAPEMLIPRTDGVNKSIMAPTNFAASSHIAGISTERSGGYRMTHHSPNFINCRSCLTMVRPPLPTSRTRHARTSRDLTRSRTVEPRLSMPPAALESRRSSNID